MPPLAHYATSTRAAFSSSNTSCSSYMPLSPPSTLYLSCLSRKGCLPFLFYIPLLTSFMTTPHFLYDCLPFLPHYSVSSTKAGLTYPYVKGRRRYLGGSVGEAPQVSLNCKSRHSSTHHHPPPSRCSLFLSFQKKCKTRFC